MKLWAGRFAKSTDGLVDNYNASISFDKQLASYDIIGSLAHVNMLGEIGYLSNEEVTCISAGLKRIGKKLQQGELSFSLEEEDIHMNIERFLLDDIGEVAGKLHLGRSRNDQVALDMHLYLRDQIIQIIGLLYDLMNVLYTIAKTHVHTVMPGYTHLQRAEPIRLAHHLLAYFNMFLRDVGRLKDSFKRVNISPLGAGALAGSGIPVDRQLIATTLYFDGIYANSLDAVSDRDFIVEFLSQASLIMMHFSRLSEEIILWSSQEFSFVTLDDSFCTGSSMMPQKKNPDVCELARGKTGRVYGALMGMLTMLKGLPLAYNKDMQEDKEGVFDTVTTLKNTLSVYTPMLASMTFNQMTMRRATENDYANATNLANYLVTKGLTFRSAHEITGKIVLHCIDANLLLKDLSLSDYQLFYDHIDNSVYQYLEIEAVIEAHQAEGGTAQKCVEFQLKQAKNFLAEIEVWLKEKEEINLALNFR